MIEIKKSRNGATTAKIRDIFFHSAYDPIREAENFCIAQKLNDSRTVVLIEPGLNYIADFIRGNYPSIKILSIYIHDLFYENDLGRSDFCYNYKNDDASLKVFLSSTLKEIDIEGLRIIIWPPALKADSDIINIINDTVLQHLREMHGNIATISGLGKKYFTNFIKNFMSIDKFSVLPTISAPVLIAGSGPGLSFSVKFIKKNRKKFFLLALPSSIVFLRNHEIIPDIVVSTDPGYYAQFHLAWGPDTSVAAPLTSCLPHENLQRNNFFLFNQNYFLEKNLVNNNNFPLLPSHGTVAGSALFFALKITDGPVFLTGLDFSFIDLLSHPRPHTFDDHIDKNSTRINPLTDLYFKRNIPNSERITGRRRTTKSLKAYAGWFRVNSYKLKNRCFFIENGFSTNNGFITIPESGIEDLLSENLVFEVNAPREFMNTNRAVMMQKTLNYLSDYLDNILNKITTLSDGNKILNLLNNELVFNLYLPELLEFKRHFNNKNGQDVQDKAVALVMKTKFFVGKFKHYV